MTDRGFVSGTRDDATFPVRLDGYTDLPPGKIASVVTFLERTEPPTTPPAPHPGLSVRLVPNPTVAWFRALYRRIGEDWLWASAIAMPDDRLAAEISRRTVEILALTKDGDDVGLAELDFSKEGDAEIVTLGVVGEAIGTGAARHLMDHALSVAFRPGVRRVWLHTCTFDHPAAARFYRRNGFRAWKYAIKISDDPRRAGILPRTAAPHVPLIEP
jgi:GNAT superfamily N-acetyltransferase